MYRTRKTVLKYAAYLRTRSKTVCDFCDRARLDIIKEFKNTLIIRNRFPYSHWDMFNVVDHIMLIPKRHLVSLTELNEAEKLEYIRVLGEYEDQGYSIYARSFDSGMRTVGHQHTHLIKTDGASGHKWLMYLRKPYFVAKK